MQQTLATTVNAWSLEDQLRFRAWAADNAPVPEGWIRWRALDPRPGLGGQESQAFGDPIRVPLPQEGGWDTVSTAYPDFATPILVMKEKTRSQVFSHLGRLFTLSLHFCIFRSWLVMGDMQRRLGQVAQSNATALEATAAALRSEGKLLDVVGGQLMRGRVAPFSLDPGTRPTLGALSTASRVLEAQGGGRGAADPLPQTQGRGAHTARGARGFGQRRGSRSSPPAHPQGGAGEWTWEDILSSRELELSCISQSHSLPFLRTGTSF